MSTVRDATYDVLRRQGMTTIFSNPGSTEVAFLVDLPDDLEFVLALHEGSVVGIASGWAIARREPAFVLLHTTAGLGNAVGAIATARVNHAPLVVVVGQQDRRHLSLEPFLAGRLHGLAGEYPLETIEPVLAEDVPAAVERAAHCARTGQGPVLVVVPMDDWEQGWSGETVASARAVHTSGPRAEPETVARLADLVAGSPDPVLLAGSGNDSEEGWAALVRLAERLQAPVWQEPFASRAGFPQDHPLFAGHLPADRSRVREVLAGHDLMLAVGGPVLRQYPYVPEPLLPPALRAAVVTADPAEAFRSPVELAVIGEPAVVVDALLHHLPARDATGAPRSARSAPAVAGPGPGEPLRAAHVFGRLAGRLPEDTVLVEESPSSRQQLEQIVPARRPLGFLSAAMGGLGFAMPAAIGVKMADPARPVVAVVGDGSSLYAIQSLWTAAHLQVGAVFVVMANGGYAIMDLLADRRHGKPPWPAFPEVSISGLARSLGCPVVSFSDATGLDEAMATAQRHLTGQHGPLVLEARVVPDQTFAP